MYNDKNYFQYFYKNKSVHKMIFEITKLKNLRISFHKLTPTCLYDAVNFDGKESI